MALDQAEVSIILAWISGIVTADEACIALGDESGPLTRLELQQWERDAIQVGREIVTERVAMVPRVQVLVGKGRVA